MISNLTIFNSQLAAAPLGAGDLIDRSVRFYRKNFRTFILIASPPIVIGGLFLIGWMILARNLFSVNVSNSVETSFYQVFVSLGNLFIWFVQLVAVFTVMGGASRNFVRHILFGEAITFRETYKNVRSRFFGLVTVSSLIIFLLSFFGFMVFYFTVLVAFIAIAIAAWIFQFAEILLFLSSLLIGIAAVFAGVWLFFLITSRFVYIPQVMLVEGRGAFSAIGRSMNLAGKNVKRVAALFIFTLVAAYSALALLYIPLGWYAWLSGVNLPDLFTADITPAWYEISGQVITEISLILLMPVLMIGLCLLYIDERVQNEGFDIEIMAAKHLSGIHAVSRNYVNSQKPPLSENNLPRKLNVQDRRTQKRTESSSTSFLGLD